jgi:hypothetical protein
VSAVSFFSVPLPRTAAERSDRPEVAHKPCLGQGPKLTRALLKRATVIITFIPTREFKCIDLASFFCCYYRL